MTTIQLTSSDNWTALVQLFECSLECSDCWCMNHRSIPSSCPTGESAKSALKKAIDSGAAHGLLAFVEGVPAGWCAIDPVSSQIGHDFNLSGPDFKPMGAWMIHCLYVDPKFRGQGISRELIQAAVLFAKNEGATEILAFPIPESSFAKFPKEIAEFSGRLSTFEKLGFQSEVRMSDFYQVVSLRPC